MLRHYIRKIINRTDLLIFKFRNRNKEKYECPICGYTGPFKDIAPPTGLRRHAQCPNCNALERHRIQFIVIKNVFKDINTVRMNMLHIAPEPFFHDYFSQRFGEYETADLSMKGVDHNVDLQHLPFAANTYDFVFASHVLEHISNDEKAISEIRRIMKPKGIAILPVPIIAEKTIEYPEPNPNEAMHVRAAGMDYFDRYERHFSRVEKFSSSQLPKEFQLYIYEDRSQWPTRECPLRPASQGEKHCDIVPVCYV